MKQIIISLFIYLWGLTMYSQDHIFVLLDVSRSLSQNELNNAKQGLNEILKGSPLSNAFVSQGNQSDLQHFKLAVGDKLSISKFGSLSRTNAITPNPRLIQNVNTDVNSILNSISFVPTDPKTYYKLAKSKIAEFAERNGITEYKLYIISDEQSDNFGPGGAPNYPDDYTRNLVESYHTTGNPVNEAPYTIVKFQSSSNFKLAFSPKVDITNYSIPGGNPPNPTTTKPTKSTSFKIDLSSFQFGTIKKPIKVNSDKITISWACKGAPKTAQYKVRLSPLKIQGEKTQVYKTTSNSYSTPSLSAGKWKITVSSGQSNFIAKSSSTVLEVPSSGSSGFLWFFLIVALAGGGYWYWNKMRNKKIESTQVNDDSFQSGEIDDSSSEYF